MKRLREKMKKLNNRGLTLVELICAVAILSLIGTTIGSILVVSAKSYDSGMTEVNLQQEAQMVVNQINDLIIDTTATSSVTFDGTTLSIPQGEKTHYVRYDAASKNLYYYYTDASHTTDEELMASGITSFVADTSAYADSGNLFVDIGLEREGKDSPRTFQATFQITSRNGVVDTTPSASIDVVDDVVLEPNQSYTFNPVVVGISNQAVVWDIVGGSTDSTTHMIGNTIYVGSGEEGSIVHLLVKTATVDAEGNAMAMRAVRVRIRRVNTVNVNILSVNGTPYMAGTEYTITADIGGTYLEKEPWDWDTDYVEPYGITWAVNSTGAVPTAAPSITFVDRDPLQPTRAIIKLKLNEDMPRNAKLTIRATAIHPKGTFGGLNTNKTGITYGNVYGETVIDNSRYFVVENGLARGSDDKICTFDWDALKQFLINMYNSDPNLPDNPDLELVRVHRFRETGTATWSQWYGGDNGDSIDRGNDINIRPCSGLMMEYGKTYEVQVRMSVIIRNTGEEIWPFADTPTDQYMIDTVMDKVSVSFTSTLLGFDEEWGLSASRGATINKNSSNVTLFSVKKLYSLKGDRWNDVRYILERKEGSEWVKVRDLQDGQNCLVSTDGIAGEYRVKVWMKAEKCPGYNQSHTWYDYKIYEQGGDVGIFYFKAE